jgi:hypothetical protein
MSQGLHLPVPVSDVPNQFHALQPMRLAKHVSRPVRCDMLHPPVWAL